MSSGVIRRLNQGSGGVMDAARCSVCGHPARIHNAAGCVSGPCECAVTRSELTPDAPRLEVPDGIVSTPAAPPAAPAPPAPVVEVTPDENVARQVDAIIAAGKAAARRRPRQTPARPAVPTAQGLRAVVGEPDAAGEVAVAAGDVAATEPEPFDFGPFLARALYVSARWYCPPCHIWSLTGGSCLVAECRRPLEAVYLVTVPREHP